MIQFLNGLNVISSNMKKFLGLIIFMGQIKSHWKDYQSTDPSLETHIFPKIIMRKTFKQKWHFFTLTITWGLHFLQTEFQKLNLF